MMPIRHAMAYAAFLLFSLAWSTWPHPCADGPEPRPGHAALPSEVPAVF